MITELLTCPTKETTPDSVEGILQRFREEQRSFPLSEWQCILRSRPREQLEKLNLWEGKESLRNWLLYITSSMQVEKGEKKVVSSYSLPENYVHTAKKFNDVLRKDTDIPDNFSTHDVIDFLICNLIPRPNRVIDYGAGYGRQAFLFSQWDCKLFVTDAVEISYFAQDYVFKLMEFPVWEYFAHTETLEQFLQKPGFGIVHYPVWHNDTLESRSIDLAMFVWCLSEMPKKAAIYALDTCVRALKEGGYIYIRDVPHTDGWKVEKYLLRLGFKPVFFPWKLKDEEVHGTPRLYRYLPNYLNKHNGTFLNLFTGSFLRSYTPKEMLVRLLRRFR